MSGAASHPKMTDHNERILSGQPIDVGLEGAVKARQVEAREGVYRLYPRAYRSIGAIHAPKRFWCRTVEYDRHDPPQSEAIHISAIERYSRVLRVNSARLKYLPENLRGYPETYSN